MKKHLSYKAEVVGDTLTIHEHGISKTIPAGRLTGQLISRIAAPHVPASLHGLMRAVGPDGVEVYDLEAEDMQPVSEDKGDKELL